MGITPTDIDILANRFQVDDPLEIHYKISELTRELGKLTKKSKEEKPNIDKLKGMFGVK